ncbi:hypothetical protein JRO89_XS04G0085200 [Xanthoceras sorbifolium]|uniref:Uncharacterized protein n=1 Tax=Xanthoceras sorbifolium TaxID=99658 RepID=A0ABQ8I565_9ROSI|nr:hypothetical protein JRO89_XS04G0085200 [Xanthoceras sorbifolium]
MSRESPSQKASHVLDTDLRTHWSAGTNTKEWILLELDVILFFFSLSLCLFFRGKFWEEIRLEVHFFRSSVLVISPPLFLGYFNALIMQRYWSVIWKKVVTVVEVEWHKAAARFLTSQSTLAYFDMTDKGNLQTTQELIKKEDPIWLTALSISLELKCLNAYNFGLALALEAASLLQHKLVACLQGLKLDNWIAE